MAGLSFETINGLRALLCDADGNLFPSEEPAFTASADVTNAFLASLGVTRRYTAKELRRATTGMTFRRTAAALAAEHGIADVEDLETWVEREKRVVSMHLRDTLRPDRQVRDPLTELRTHLQLAVVSSSALTRLHVCLVATKLAQLVPDDNVFSAEDSLAIASSKPHPAVYIHACERLRIPPAHGLAVEDSVPGARSAIAAGCPTVGNVQFVPSSERAERVSALYDAGVVAVVSSWRGLADLLLPYLRGRTRQMARRETR